MSSINDKAFCTVHSCKDNRDMHCTNKKPSGDECPFAAIEAADDLRCVSCGAYCGDGRQVCHKCEKEAMK